MISAGHPSKFSLFELCIRYRLCRRDVVFGFVTLGTMLPFIINCVYFQQVSDFMRYHRFSYALINGSIQFVNDTSVVMHSTDGNRAADRNATRRPCPTTSPHLVGNLVNQTISENHTVDEFLDAQTEILKASTLGQIKKGGWWEPSECQANHHVAIIIPFRDRTEHLITLLARLHLLLQRQQLSYRIFVPEQAGTEIFNKARLMNIAFAFVQKNYPSYTCIIFHDVDMIPETDNNLYVCGDQPRHLSPAVNEMNYTLPYDALIGGVLALRPEHFVKVNGYSNLYWGWGGEDDDMYYRMEEEKLKVERPSTDVGRYTMLVHKKREAIPGKIRYKLVWSAKRRYKMDGLAQINTLNYTILSVSEEPRYTGVMIDIGKKPKIS